MSSTPATRVLVREKAAHTLHAYRHDPSAAQAAGGYGLEAARALGIDPARVFKTLVVSVGGQLTVAVCPVTHRLDLKAVATAVGGKRAEMADPHQVERVTGYVMGGVSPFGAKRRLPTVLDESAADFDTVLVSAGRRGLDVEVSPDDILRLTGGRMARIATT